MQLYSDNYFMSPIEVHLSGKKFKTLYDFWNWFWSCYNFLPKWLRNEVTSMLTCKNYVKNLKVLIKGWVNQLQNNLRKINIFIENEQFTVHMKMNYSVLCEIAPQGTIPRSSRTGGERGGCLLGTLESL